MTKKYQLINRKTGKATNLKYWTREDARIAKADRGFKHAILNTETGITVR